MRLQRTVLSVGDLQLPENILPSTFTIASGRGGGRRVEGLQSRLQSPMASSSKPCTDIYSAVGVR